MSGPLPDGDTIGLGIERTPCVVLGRPDSSSPLERILRERGLEPSTVEDPWLAMADLCLCGREQAAHATWGLDSAGRLAFVIDETTSASWPTHVRAELIDAVRWYLPGVSVWRFTEGALVPVAEPDTVALARAREGAAARRVAPPMPLGATQPGDAPPSAEPPRLRLAGDEEPRLEPERAPGESDTEHASANERELPDTPVISREEIDMLLGRAPRAERRPKA